MNIDAAMTALIEAFVAQCRHGEQAKSLPPEYSACGQFVGAHDRRQRGVFGTAAAISALSHQSAGNSELIRKLVLYLEHRIAVEQTIADGTSQEKTTRDSADVIKLSDELRALARVPLTVAATEQRRRAIADTLLGAIREDRGWAYFLHDDAIDVIPTAYAYRALVDARAATPLLERVRLYLTQQLRSTANTPAAIDDVARLLIIWGLSAASDADVRTLRTAFLGVRRSLDAAMRYRIEQNVEYWSTDKSHYVRIPWQLYYIELALRYAPVRVFSTQRVQKHLRGIVDDAARGGYIYPHSGRYVSARTSAAVLDLLSLVSSRRAIVGFLGTLTAVDAARQALGSSFVRVPLALLAIYAIVTSIYEAATGSQTFLANVAPDLIAAALLAALFGRER